MSQRPNFYELLELDPTVDDWRAIETRLVEKKRQWSKDRTMGNPKRKREAARALDLVEEIESTLKDPKSRREEAQAEENRQKSQREQRFQELDNAIAVIKSGGVCDKTGFDKLCKQFQGTFSSKEVERRLRKAGVQVEKDGAEEKRKRRKKPRIDSTQAGSIRRNLDLLGLGTLYDFLELKSQSSPKALAERAVEIYRENQRLGKTTPEASAQNELAGIGQKIFRSDEEKAKYDAHLAVEAMDGLKGSIELAGHDRILSPGEMDTLVRQARERGVPAEDARDYLEEYAEKRKWVIQRDVTLPAEDLPRCGFCSTLAANASASRCTQCGKPLAMPCPKCGTENPTENAACEHCGCRVGDAPLVHGLLEEGRRQLTGGDPAGALRRFAKALHYWPDWEPVLKAQTEARQRQEEREKSVQEIEGLVDSARLIAARSALERCQRSFGEEGLDSLASRIAQGISRAEASYSEGEKKRRSGDGEGALDHYEEALAACADHEPARRALAASPPPPPRDLKAQPLSTGFRLTWKSAVARRAVRYRVLRKKGAAPRDETDGEVLGEVHGTLLDDPKVGPGAPWHYAVFALRAGVTSATGAHAGPFLRTVEVEDLQAAAGDGEITLTWKRPAGCRQVEVVRLPGSAPARASDGASVVVSGNSAHDTNLENGKRYGYRVVAVFADPERPGREIPSAGAVVTATPVAPPPAVRDLRCSRSGKTLTLTWTPVPAATVQIRRMTELPDYRPGLIVPVSQASQFGDPITASRAGSAQVALTGQGRFHFVPLTVREGTAVVGEARAVVTLDPCTDLASRRSGRTVALTWSWPEGTEEALVSWRFDQAPKDPEESVSGRARVTRRQYERSGCWELRHAESKPHHFTVFAHVPEGDLYAPGTSIVETLGQQVALHYRVVAKRHWLRRRVEDAWIELSGNVNGLGPLPALLVVGKARSVPVSPRDGRLLTEVQAVRFEEGRARVPIPSQHWGSGLFLKLFFQDPEQARRIRLLPAAQEELRLS